MKKLHILLFISLSLMSCGKKELLKSQDDSVNFVRFGGVKLEKKSPGAGHFEAIVGKEFSTFFSVGDDNTSSEKLDVKLSGYPEDIKRDGVVLEVVSYTMPKAYRFKWTPKENHLGSPNYATYVPGQHALP